ncbi:MAG: DUF4124 domain-containing protein [Burkholderiales bacterium]|nr:DUF4124 domain-containing protein [Burkholderiales bacterium]
MRSLLFSLLMLGGLAWWQRDWIMQQIQPPSAEQWVYTWRDAAGHSHYSETPDVPNAKRVKLPPLQTLPAARAAGPAATKPAPDQCNEPDPLAQAQCINAQENQHNRDIDKMTKSQGD